MELLPTDRYEGPDTHLLPSDYEHALWMVDPGACNAAAVVQSLAEVKERLITEAHERGEGTSWWNGHPIMVLYIWQLTNIARVALIVDDLDRFGWCITYCKKRKEVPRCSDPAQCAHSAEVAPADLVVRSERADTSAV